MKSVAIILDGELKSALAAARSLGRAGVTVVAGAPRETAMTLHSKYTKHSFTYPSPKTDREAFIEAVRAEVVRWQHQTDEKSVLFCFSDATHISLAEHVEALTDHVLFPLPGVDAFATAFDKRKTAALAKQLDIAVIPEHDVADKDTFSYPMVVKPTQSVVWTNGASISGTAAFVFSEIELVETYKAIGTKPLIQSVVAGREYGVEMLCRDGEVLASYTHRRVRSLSPTGGAAVVKETAVMDAQTEVMQRYARMLAHTLQWTGPIMVEWKVERETKTPRLMEINGRFWGSLPLAVRAGVDFPYLYYQLAVGESSATEHAHQQPHFSPRHIRTQHFLGDVRWLVSVLFDKTKLRSTMYPNRLVAIWLFMVEPLLSCSDVFWWSDMRPAAMELIDVRKRKS